MVGLWMVGAADRASLENAEVCVCLLLRVRDRPVMQPVVPAQCAVLCVPPAVGPAGMAVHRPLQRPRPRGEHVVPHLPPPSSSIAVLFAAAAACYRMCLGEEAEGRGTRRIEERIGEERRGEERKGGELREGRGEDRRGAGAGTDLMVAEAVVGRNDLPAALQAD